MTEQQTAPCDTAPGTARHIPVVIVDTRADEKALAASSAPKRCIVERIGIR